MSATKTKPESTGAEIVPLRQREPLPDEVVLAIAAGNLAPLEPRMRAVAIRTICEDGNLPVSLSPVILMPGQGGTLKPYVTAIGASWVADNKRVSTKILGTETVNNVYIVRMMAQAGDGRSVEDIGAVAIGGKSGQDLADALMKATTKAYRRTVLRLSGLPLTDEDDGTGPPRRIDYETGEIIEAAGAFVSDDRASAEPKIDDDRLRTSKRMYATIRDKFGKQEDASAIGHELVCTRFGLASTRDATTEQLREAIGAVERWSPEWAPKALNWLEIVGQASTPTMVADVALIMKDEGVRDPYLLAALAVAQKRYPIPDDVFAASGPAVDDAMAP